MENFDPVEYINEPRWQQSRPGLARIEELLERLGRPQDMLRYVHVAGTNGKGSTSTYLAEAIKASGFKTGLFTSPFIEHFCDRIKINGAEISMLRLREVTLSVKQVADDMADHPTEFELMTAVAFLYFAQEACDLAVVEVGMGGRLDSTNVIEHPEVSVITALDLDHQEYLGSTLEAIAEEKAGIIKSGCPVVSWPQDSDAMQVVRRRAEEDNAPLVFSDFRCLKQNGIHTEEGRFTRRFWYKNTAFETRMIGSYQPQNASVAIETLRVLQSKGWDISDEAIISGIANAQLAGRFEILEADPLLLVDGAHNRSGIQALCDSLSEVVPGTKVVFILGILKDKGFEEMINLLLPLAHAFVTVAPPNPRAVSARDLATCINSCVEHEGLSIEVHACDAYGDALEQAKFFSEGVLPVCACGSLYSIAPLKQVLGYLSWRELLS